MKIVVITPPEFVDGEAAAIAQLLNHGAWAVHLRKPGAGADALAALVEQVPDWCRPRLVLHDAFELCARYGLGGVHLNRRNPVAPPGHRGRCSRSVHGMAELRACLSTVDYALLSPIFDSISKVGYHAAYTPHELAEARAEGLLGPRVLALGGVSLARLPEVAAMGFGGAALLGDVWQRVGTAGFADYLQQLCEAAR